MLRSFERDFANLKLPSGTVNTFTHSFSFLSSRTRILYFVNQTDTAVFVHFGIAQDKSQGFKIQPFERCSFCLCYIYDKNLQRGLLKTVRFGIFSSEFFMQPLYLSRSWRKIFIIYSMQIPRTLLELSYCKIHPSKSRCLPTSLKILFHFKPRNFWFEYRLVLNNLVMRGEFFLCSCASAPCELNLHKNYEENYEEKSIRKIIYE